MTVCGILFGVPLCCVCESSRARITMQKVQFKDVGVVMNAVIIELGPWN